MGVGFVKPSFRHFLNFCWGVISNLLHLLAVSEALNSPLIIRSISEFKGDFFLLSTLSVFIPVNVKEHFYFF
jgi:hypothetical protein